MLCRRKGTLMKEDEGVRNSKEWNAEIEMPRGAALMVRSRSLLPVWTGSTQEYWPGIKKIGAQTGDLATSKWFLNRVVDRLSTNINSSHFLRHSKLQ